MKLWANSRSVSSSASWTAPTATNPAPRRSSAFTATRSAARSTSTSSLQKTTTPAKQISPRSLQSRGTSALIPTSRCLTKTLPRKKKNGSLAKPGSRSYFISCPAALLARRLLANCLLGRRLFLRNVLFVHLALFPVQHKRRLRIVGNQRRRKMNRAVLLYASHVRLTNYFHFHIRHRRGIELRVAGHEGYL